MTRRTCWTVVALLAFVLPHALRAQAVEGRVSDPDGAPVSGARMLLLDATYATVTQGVTSDDGTYRLEAPAAGDYVVVTELEGYANQTSEPLALAAEETARHDVVLRQRVGETGLAATDTLEGAALMARAVADACRQQFMPALHGILFGAVLDSATADPVPQAETVLEFDDPAGMGNAGEMRVRADENGIYLICDAPAGRDLEVHAEAVGMSGRSTETRLRSGTMKKLDLRLAVSDPDAPGAVFGRVYEQESGKPIAGAEVRVKDQGIGTVTNERGVFRMPDVPRGLHVVTVDHFGHGHGEQAVRILGGQATEVDVRLSVQPVEMAPMLVRVRPRRWFSAMSALEDRIANGFGVILTEEDFEVRQPRNIADAIRGLPGVRVRQSGSAGSGGTYSVQFRNAQNMAGRPCHPMVWVDGQKVGRDSDALTSVFGPDLYAIEVYRSAGETPGEFSDQDANCGVIVTWTKRGR